jgi:hypothetical protein
MSKGPWEENSMWTPDLEDSEFEGICEDDMERDDLYSSDSDFYED